MTPTEAHSPWPPDATAPEPVVVPDAASDPAMAAYVLLFRRKGIGTHSPSFRSSAVAGCSENSWFASVTDTS